MIFFILAPETTNNIMRFRIRPEFRPAPPRFPLVPVVVMFVFGIFLFNEIAFRWPTKNLPRFDSFHYYGELFSVLWMASTGVVACFWPLQFMRFFVKPLRKVTDAALNANATAKAKIIFVSKMCGVVFLLAASYVFHLIGITTR
jgi:hypothetical protein